ncbi:hypothetical protein BJV82DRAFT_675823 [Fennellomyces sp. T-0311]|nr:hypothetical protein BJV82DRAFT_675823 [Fennellomyces sp. T-0311]
MEAFPDNRGMIVHHEGGQCITLEVNLETKAEQQQALREGIAFTPAITIIATMAQTKESLVKKVRLSHLPLLHFPELEQGLRQTLSVYGNVLDVGVNLHEKTKAYMGNGFAVLDIKAKPNQKFEKLDYSIP